MRHIKFKKWLLGGSITGAFVFALVGSLMYGSVSEFFNPAKKIVTEADEKTHNELSRIEELLTNQGKTSSEINNSLRQLLGNNYAEADNEVALKYLEERLKDETIEGIVFEKDKFIEEVAKINTEDLRELKTSDLNELSEKSPETMLIRLSGESKEVIETIASEYSSKFIKNLVIAGYAKEVIADVIEVADLREIKTSDLNELSEKSPETILERLKGEDKMVIETLAKEHSSKIIKNLINAGYSEQIITNVVDVADLRELKISDLNELSEKSPETMLERLKGEDKMIIEYISKEYSSHVFQNLINAGYSKQIITNVIEVADLRELKISDLNELSEKSPETMLIRLNTEGEAVIKYLEERTKVLENVK